MAAPDDAGDRLVLIALGVEASGGDVEEYIDPVEAVDRFLLLEPQDAVVAAALRMVRAVEVRAWERAARYYGVAQPRIP